MSAQATVPLVATSFASLLACTALPARAQAPAITERSIENPFVKAASVKRFRDYLARVSAPPADPITLPDNVWPVLPTIEYWGYRFEQVSGQNAKAYFVQRYSMDQLLQEAHSALKSFDQNNCSFAHVGQASYVVTEKKISFSAPISGKARACTKLPGGGEIKTNVGNIGGSAQGTIGFIVAQSADADKFRGTISPTDFHMSASAKAVSVFGIDLNSVVGQLIKGISQISSLPIFVPISLSSGEMPVWQAMSRTSELFDAHGGSAAVTAQYLLDGGGAVSQRDYAQFLASMHGLSWSTQPYWEMDSEHTAFSYQNGHLTLTITFAATIKDDGRIEAAIQSSEEEVNLLKSFSEENRSVVAVRGDSWWRLASRYYGNGFLADILAAHQLNAASRLVRVGQTIVLPTIDKLGDVPDTYLVKPGDSLSNICENIEEGSPRHCVKRLIALNPRAKRMIYAMQMLRLQKAATPPPQSP